jgi:hypothetical protein
VVGFDQRMNGIVKQACEDHFFAHARLLRAVCALKYVIGCLLHPQFEEVEKGGLGRHLGKLFHLSVCLRIQKKISDTSTVAARFDLRFDLGGLWKLFGLCRGLVCSGAVVQLLHHVRLERLGLRFGAHQLHGCGAAEARNEQPSVDLDHKTSGVGFTLPQV